MTVAEIIDIGDVSTYLALNKISRGTLFGGNTDPRLGLMLAMETDAVRWQNDFDSTDTSLTQTANYLYGLCGALGVQANAIISGGSSGSVITPSSIVSIVSPIMILGSDFADATHWTGTNSLNQVIESSYTLQVFWNDVQRYLLPGEWIRTSTGFQILIVGFNATTTHIDSAFFVDISR